MHIKLHSCSKNFVEKCKELSVINSLVIIGDNLGTRNLARLFVEGSNE